MIMTCNVLSGTLFVNDFTDWIFMKISPEVHLCTTKNRLNVGSDPCLDREDSKTKDLTSPHCLFTIGSGHTHLSLSSLVPNSL